MDCLRVGIIGCGNISGIYFKNLQHFKATSVVACGDLDTARAEKAASEFGVKQWGSPESVLANPEVDVVLNLTIPSAHFSVAAAALKAGKHVYNEKPLAAERSEGKNLLELAAKSGLRVGGAPDTFLGASLQTCRQLIDDGAIGKAIGFNGFMMGHGPENWHPAPEFFYRRGGGPLFDMGPYYLTALVSLLGPIKRVGGQAKASFSKRDITNGALTGTQLDVEIPTHIIGLLEFEGGAIGQLTTSFDVWGGHLPNLEIYGSEGSLSVPDPNNFSGTVKLLKPGKEWEEIPLSHRFAENSRGLGLLDLAYALSEKREARASGALAFHVLDAMHGIIEASDKSTFLTLAPGASRPAALSADGPEDDL